MMVQSSAENFSTIQFKKNNHTRLILYLGILLAISPSISVAFRWPVDSPKVTQGYGVVSPSCPGSNPFHAGIDMTIEGKNCSNEDCPVLAAASGKARALAHNNVNTHGLGNVVIIDHHNGLFSLYGHLKGITTGIDGVEIVEGAQIGIMGNTPGGFGVHLHFEIKRSGVLGSDTDDGKNFGYTPGHPNWYSYHDPEEYLPEDVIKSPRSVSPIDLTPIRILAPNLNIRPCPEKDDNECPGVSFVKQGQVFVAYRRFTATTDLGDWYEIYLPSYQSLCPKGSKGTEADGPSSGWIAARDPLTGEILAIEDPSASQIEVIVFDTSEVQSLNVREQPSDVSNIITKVRQKPDKNLRQRFINFEIQQGPCAGVVQEWYRIYLPNDPYDLFSESRTNSVIPSGWVCADFLIDLTDTDTVACHTILSDDPAPSPYGLAWNWFSSEKELLLSAACESDRTTITVGSDTAPSTGSGRTRSWGKVYAYDGSSWNGDKPIPVTCTGETIDVDDVTPQDSLPDYWCYGTLTGSLPLSIRWFAAYTCIYTGTTWQCGCTNEQCSSSFWQLQGIER